MKTSSRPLVRVSSLALPVVAVALLAGAAGCKKNPATVNGVDPTDPAMANMAQPPAPAQGQQPYAGSQQTVYRNGKPTRVMGQNEQGYYNGQGTNYPPDQQYNGQGSNYAPDQQYAAQGTYDDSGNSSYDQLEAPQAPPPLPEYAQPAVTRPNSVWTPGYWAYNPRGYYWVPGAWVTAPYQGALWTPPYWQHTGPMYRFHPGYWGRHVGFYGGIPYGHGYPGRGFYGGYWSGPNFYYNRAVTVVGPGITFEYVHNAPNYGYAGYSYNGPGGVPLLPISAEIFAMREHHLHPVRMQYESLYRAGMDPAQFWVSTGHLGIYAVTGVYAPERYYGPPPVVIAPGYGWHHHGDDDDQGEDGPRFIGAPEWHDHGHWDNGWHGHKGEGERGEWHDNGGGNDQGEGHGHGHGHGHD